MVFCEHIKEFLYILRQWRDSEVQSGREDHFRILLYIDKSGDLLEVNRKIKWDWIQGCQ